MSDLMPPQAIHDAKANADIFLILYDMFLEKESENVERQNLFLRMQSKASGAGERKF